MNVKEEMKREKLLTSFKTNSRYQINMTGGRFKRCRNQNLFNYFNILHHFRL